MRSIALVAIAVWGQRALTAMPSERNSPAMPRTKSDMSNLATEYAAWGLNHLSCMLRGGEMLRMCGLRPAWADLRRCGAAYLDTRKVPLTLIWCMRSNFFMSVSSVEVNEMALALFTRMSIPPKRDTVFSIASFTCSSERMSTIRGSAFPPAFSISAAAVKIVPGS